MNVDVDFFYFLPEVEDCLTANIKTDFLQKTIIFCQWPKCTILPSFVKICWELFELFDYKHIDTYTNPQSLSKTYTLCRGNKHILTRLMEERFFQSL